MRRLASLFASITLLAVFALPVVGAAPIAVDCTSDHTALRSAVLTAPARSTLVITGTCYGMLDIARDLTIKSAVPDARLTSDPSAFPTGEASVMSVRAGARASIRGLTVSGAIRTPGFVQLSNHGALTLIDSIVTNGGINVVRNFGTLTLRGSALSGNQGKGDAPIDNRGGTVTLIQSLISGNGNSEVTGAITNDRAGTVTVIDSSIRGNFGYTNVISNAGAMTFRGSSVADNQDFFATMVNGGTMSFTDSIVSGNQGGTAGLSGQGGGGIDNTETGTLLLRDSIVRSNSTFGDGGGIYNAGVADLRDSTVTLNTAAGDGGGIFNLGSLELRDTTIVDNTPNNCVGC
jgi:hypothetical protein